MQNILIIGGLGYIGAHMAQLLVDIGGYKVTILDNNSNHQPNHVEGAEVVHGNVGDPALLDILFTTTRFDAVMHFASFIQVGESVVHPDKYYQNNVQHTITLLNAMARQGIKRFVFSSTAAVFGEPHYTPIDEAHPKLPLSPYGRSKYIIEQILPDYERAYGIKSGSLRYFNAAGCDSKGRVGELHEPETHLIPLILQAASGRREWIQVFGNDYPTPDGTCIRDYIHVADLAEAHLLLLNYLNSGGEERSFNLGTGMGFSVRQIIRAVQRVTGKPIIYMVQPRREGDPAVLVADGRKAQDVLQWEPRYSSLENIVKDAWQWEQKLFS